MLDSESVKTSYLVRSVLTTTALAAIPACVGYATVDGYDGEYVAAPVGIETYPQYRFADGYAYNVNGVYYHQHEGRWVRYREAPRGMVRVEVRGGERR